jgi:NADH dehydrogenase [ubiquinone] 1 alpha subcomplex assembly factor 3
MFKPILRRNAPNLLRSTTQCLRAASTSRISIAAARQTSRPYHASLPRCKGAGNKSEQPTTSFADLDVLGGVPPPSTSVDVCMADGFGLNSGITISNGDGVLLLNAEAFTWRPWVAIGEKKLVNKKGQFHIPAETLSVIDLLWPRPGMCPSIS